MTPTFQAAAASDYEAITVLVQEYYALDGIAFHAELVLPAILTLLQNDHLGRIWCIRAEGLEDAGYMILTYGFDIEFGGRLATLTDLYLRPEFRRQGIGTAAFEFLDAFCRELGLKSLELQVLPHNAGAERLYSRLGFEALDRRPMHKHIRPAVD